MKEQETKKKVNYTLRIGLGCLIAGIVLLIIGFILYDKADIKQYKELIYVNESFSADDIEKVQINMAVADLTIQQSDGDEITLVGENIPAKAYEWSADANSFTLKSIDHKWYEQYKSGEAIFGSDAEAKFTLSLPEKEYKELTLNAGVGEVKVNGIYAENVVLDMGTGDCEITDSTFGIVDADCGVGELDFSGKLTGGLEMDAGVGDVTLDIDGCYSDYDIDYDTGIGDVEIDKGTNQHPVGVTIPINIDAGIGDIEIKFN